MEYRKVDKRIKWIDSIRGIAFLMVIYHHQLFMDNVIMQYIYPVFLSTFFVVSGFLWKCDIPFSEFLERRTRTLFLPFVIFSFIIVATRYVFTFNAEIEPFVPSMVSMLLQDGKDDSIWFIPALYIYSLFTFAIVKSIGNIRISMLIGVVLALINWVLLYRMNIPRLYYHIDQMGFGSYWLLIGCLMKEYYPILKSMIDNKWHKLILPTATIIYAIMIYFWGSDIITFYGSSNLCIWFVVSIIGLYVMYGISNIHCTQNPLLCYIGANTLMAFVVHGKIHKLVSAAICHTIDIESLSKSAFLLTGIAETFIVAILMLIPICIVNRYFPWLLGKGFRLWKSPSRIIDTDVR